MASKYNKDFLKSVGKHAPIDPQIKPIGKTVKQIAEDLGVTKQAVFDKKKQLSSELVNLVSKVGGTWYFTLQGESLIKQAFSKKEVSSNYKEFDSKFDSNLIPNLIATLQENQVMLRKELNEKNEQIEQLQKLLDQQQQLTLLDKNKTKQIEKKSHWWNKKD